VNRSPPTSVSSLTAPAAPVAEQLVEIVRPAMPEVDTTSARIDTPLSAVLSHPDAREPMDEVVDADGHQAVGQSPTLRSAIARILGLVIAITTTLVLAYRFGARPDVFVATAHVTAQPREAAPGAAPVPPPAPTSVEAQMAPLPNGDIPPGMGLLVLTNAQPGHRVFVDGHVVGQTPRAVLVKCGAAVLRIGRNGRAVRVEIPCGQELRVDYP
jgi:hypothetical protein